MKYIFLIFLISCGSVDVHQKLNPEVIYKRDMIMNVDGHIGDGVMVVPQKDVNKFHIEARGDLDLFTFTTCHREEIAEKAWNVKEDKGWFIFRRKIEKKREVKIDYKPTSLEKDGGCPIFLAGYEIKNGRHSWGFVDFETPEATLPAVVSCNGSEYNSSGVSACQSRAGLIQKMAFSEIVQVNPDSGCELDRTSGSVFEFEMNKGQCVYAFQGTESGKIHRLTTLGYEEILIRN